MSKAYITARTAFVTVDEDLAGICSVTQRRGGLATKAICESIIVEGADQVRRDIATKLLAVGEQLEMIERRLSEIQRRVWRESVRLAPWATPTTRDLSHAPAPAPTARAASGKA